MYQVNRRGEDNVGFFAKEKSSQYSKKINRSIVTENAPLRRDFLVQQLHNVATGLDITKPELLRQPRRTRALSSPALKSYRPSSRPALSPALIPGCRPSA